MRESVKLSGSEYITTGIAARYCGVSHVTVLRWIHAGHLLAFRLPSGHYRVARADFNEFLTRHNIPCRELQKSVVYNKQQYGREPPFKVRNGKY